MSRTLQTFWTVLLALTLVSWPLAAEAGPTEAPLHGSAPLELDERASDPEVEERQRGKAHAQELLLEGSPTLRRPGFRGRHDASLPVRPGHSDRTLAHGLRAPPR